MSAFESRRVGGVQTILCPPVIDPKNAEELLQKLQEDITAGDQLVVLDFSKTKDIAVAAYRFFTLIHQALKKNNGMIISQNLGNTIGKQLTSAGLESIFNPRTRVDEACKILGLETPKAAGKPVVDVAFVNPFIDATINTLTVQANTQVKAGKPQLKTDQSSTDIEIVAVVSLTSNAFHGTIALCFPKKVFLEIYSSMVGEKYDEITKETEDAAGEILNMIFGQAKAALNDKAGYQIQKAIPAVIRGADIKVHHLARQVALVLPFETGHGSFYLEVSVD